MIKIIKYKAKRVDNGEYISGFVYEHEPPLQCCTSDITETSHWYILNTGFADWNMARPIEPIEILSETLEVLEWKNMYIQFQR